jgi:predicted metal-dependent peptidase
MLRKLNRAEEDLMVQWRLRANEVAPFLGPLLFSLRYVSVDSQITDTAASHLDSFTVSINFSNLPNLLDIEDPNNGAFVLLHEAQHFLLNHAARFEAFESAPDVAKSYTWNIAGDFEINVILREIMGREYESFMYPERFDLQAYKGAEFYYRALLPESMAMQNASSTDDDLNGQSDGSEGNPSGQGDDDLNGQSGDGDSGGQGDDDPNGQSDGGSRAGDQPAKGCGSASGEMGAEAADRQVAKFVDRQFGKLPESAVKEIIEQSLNSGKQAGSLPGDLVSQILDSMTPKISWKTVLRNSVVAASGTVRGSERSNWRRPSRRFRVDTSYGRIFLPAKRAVQLRIAVVRDTSGSMSDTDLAVVNTEIENIIRELGNSKVSLTVVDCDAEIHQKQKITAGTVDGLQNVAGRGGTDMMVGIQYVLDPRNMNSVADVVIVLTDGESPWDLAFQPTKPVIVCVIPYGDAVSQHVIDAIPPWVRQVVPVV